MAVVNFGFNGTVSEAPWARMWSMIGPHDMVRDTLDWKVTPVTSLNQTVRVDQGDAASAGVYSESSTTMDVTLPTVASGSRWATIVRRVNWNTHTVTVAYAGQATSATVTQTYSQIGNIYDHPLALVKVTAGSTVPVIEQDLRVTQAFVMSGWGPWYPMTYPVGYMADPNFGFDPAYRYSLSHGRIELRGTFVAVDGAISGSGNVNLGYPLPGDAAPAHTLKHIAPCEEKPVGSTGVYVSNVRCTMGFDGQITFVNRTNPGWVSVDGWVYDTF